MFSQATNVLMIFLNHRLILISARIYFIYISNNNYNTSQARLSIVFASSPLHIRKKKSFSSFQVISRASDGIFLRYYYNFSPINEKERFLCFFGTLNQHCMTHRFFLFFKKIYFVIVLISSINLICW